MRRMVLVALCAIPAMLYSQPLLVNPSSANNTWEYFWTIDDTSGGVPLIDSEVRNFTMSATSTDTLQAIFLPYVKTVLFSLMASETSTVYVDYATSLDGSSYTPFAVKDSLSHAADGYGVKLVDFTSTLLGAPFAKFRLRGSALAYAWGTSSTPKFWASYTLKLY